MKVHPLIRAIKILVPGADAEIAKATEWRSMTFAGQQLSLSVQLSGDSARAAGVDALLAQNEYDLPGLLVADINVTRRTMTSDGIELLIDALVLED
jgi:hypothetical protein